MVTYTAILVLWESFLNGQKNRKKLQLGSLIIRIFTERLLLLIKKYSFYKPLKLLQLQNFQHYGKKWKIMKAVKEWKNKIQLGEILFYGFPILLMNRILTKNWMKLYFRQLFRKYESWLNNPKDRKGSEWFWEQIETTAAVIYCDKKAQHCARVKAPKRLIRES